MLQNIHIQDKRLAISLNAIITPLNDNRLNFDYKEHLYL